MNHGHLCVVIEMSEQGLSNLAMCVMVGALTVGGGQRGEQDKSGLPGQFCSHAITLGGTNLASFSKTSW